MNLKELKERRRGKKQSNSVQCARREIED